MLSLLLLMSSRRGEFVGKSRSRSSQRLLSRRPIRASPPAAMPIAQEMLVRSPSSARRQNEVSARLARRARRRRRNSVKTGEVRASNRILGALFSLTFKLATIKMIRPTRSAPPTSSPSRQTSGACFAPNCASSQSPARARALIALVGYYLDARAPILPD